MDWFSTDWHLGHTNILKYSKRPFNSIGEMDNAIITNVITKVQPGDTLWFLGDLCMGRIQKITDYLKMLPSYFKFNVISGNHDKELIYNQKELVEAGYIDKFYTSYAETKIDGINITLCHYALRVWNKSHHGAFHLYGHSHGSLADDPNARSFDCGVDCFDYSVGWEKFTPISWDQVKKKMAKKEWKPIDHHEPRWSGKPSIPDPLRDPQGYKKYKDEYEKVRVEP